MKVKQLTIMLIFLLTLPFFLNYSLPTKTVFAQTSPSLYVGVNVAFESIAATEQLIDNISAYTNLFVIGCYGNYNETRLNIISQYVYDKGLSFIVYTNDPRYPSRQWFENASIDWGNRFLGIYFYDEPGGKQLDQSSYPIVTEADNLSDAATQYVNTLNWWLRSGRHAITSSFPSSTNYELFTSDYSLYWYDYQAGYDTVFAEFALNYDRTLNIDLCRGAATVQNKSWGVMITNKYTLWPYMENESELYNDMKLAYENGAKYIIVFDSDVNWTQNVLLKPQQDAMRQFWQYAQTHPRTISPVSERAAYVLPEDYTYGFRSPTQDRIWGLWNSDSPDIPLLKEYSNLTLQISMGVAALFRVFGNNLDIVYPDASRTIESVGYSNVVYWNDSRLISNLTATTSPNGSVVQATQSPEYKQNSSSTFYVIAACVLATFVAVETVLMLKIRRLER